jgi:hypothetical protein
MRSIHNLSLILNASLLNNPQEIDSNCKDVPHSSTVTALEVTNIFIYIDVGSCSKCS